MSAAITAIKRQTTNSSIKVKPAWSRPDTLFIRAGSAVLLKRRIILPVAYVRIWSFTAVYAICSARPEVKAGGMMHSRSTVLKCVTPRIVSNHFDIGPAPFLFLARRRGNESVEALLRAGIPVHMDIEAFKGRL